MWWWAQAALGADPWWDAGWTERSRLSFDNDAAIDDVVDLPVLVVLRDGVNFDHARYDPDEIRFVDADGVTVLPAERDGATVGGVSRWWVRVPRIDARSTTDVVWMYYDNPAAEQASDPPAVWRGFDAVFHLERLADSALGLIGDPLDDATAVEDGVVGRGYALDGDNDAIAVPGPSG
ncbi:MAG: DUF2341 domain-containing protein, partial [Myxococcota bacterium]